MQKLIDNIKELNKKFFLLEIAIICLFSLTLWLIFYGKQDVFLIDVGREAYIPWQMLKGKVLYKDIFNVYGPLGYQINAIGYSILGVKLQTLYTLGFLNTLIIGISAFFCTKLFTTKKNSLIITLLLLTTCAFTRTLFNFIFSYSYCANYALSGYFLSLLTMLYYIKNKNFKTLFLSFLFAGSAFASKIEYLPYFALIFFSLPFFKLSYKQIFLTITAFLIFPLISFGYLFTQGVNINDLINAAKLILQLPKTNAAEYFYNAYGLYFNPLFINQSINYLIKSLPSLLISGTVLYGLNWLKAKQSNNKITKNILNIITLILIIIASVKMFPRFFPKCEQAFAWIGIITSIIAIIFLIYTAITKIKNNSLDNETKTLNNMFLYLVLAALSVSIKGICGITTECYGTYALAALLLPFCIFFLNYIPQLSSKIDKNALASTIQNLCSILIILTLSTNLIKTFENPLYPIKTNQGTIFTKKMFKSQNQYIHYIIKNTPKNSTIVSMPEGAMINFLSQRNSNNKYYYLIPVNVELFGEENIIKDFKKDMPDYFILNNIPYSPFNVGNLCSYAPKICNFVEKNYDPIAQTQDYIEFTLYKKKIKK